MAKPARTSRSSPAACPVEDRKLLLKNVHHRIKNNLQIISSLLKLGASHVKEETALEILEDSRDRIKAIALIHDQLSRGEEATRVDLEEYLKRLAAHAFRSSRNRTDNITLHLHVGRVLLDIDKAISCGLIINELLSNSLRHAFRDGRRGGITIRFKVSGSDKYEMSFSDNGIGLPKGLKTDGCETLGMQVIHSLVSQLSGSLSVRSNGGCEFTIIFSQ